MKKKKILASLVLATAALSLAACGEDTSSSTSNNQQNTSTSTPTSAPTSTPTSAPTSTPTSTTVAPEKNTIKLTIHYNPGNDAYDKEVTLNLEKDPITGNKIALFEESPTDDYRSFVGWYTDEALTQPITETVFTEDAELYAKWETKGTVAKEFRYDASKLNNGVGLTGSIFNFTKADTLQDRNKATINAKGETISGNQTTAKNAEFEFTAPADGNLNLVLENGSGSSASEYTVTSSDNSVSGNICDFVGGTDAYNAKLYTLEVKKGVKYSFKKTNGTIYVYDLLLTCNVELSEVEDIEISSEGIVDYIEGQTYNKSGISANVVYANKSSEALDTSKLTIDSSKLDMSKPGIQKVTVSYECKQKLYGQDVTKTLSKEIDVNVYALDSIELGFNAIVKGKNTTLGGNGTYVNNTVKQVYVSGENYSSANLSVTAICKLTDGDKTITKEFLLNNNLYTIDNETSFSAEGVKKTIKVSYTTNNITKDASYNVYVVTEEPSIINNVVQVVVDQKFSGTIGTIINGYNTFTSIQQALDFLNCYQSKIDGKAITLMLNAGTYNEKLEFNLPNMTVVGENKDTTKIEWNSLYGLTDESGFVHTTDSTQTVAVREGAENFKISGVTISNYWNNRDAYISSGIYGAKNGKNSSEHRALALLVQSDKFIMDDCKILGMQDTIELFTGRQLIKNTYICGTTDFIFGSNNTTLFENCTIEVKASEDNQTGGYITAFKGYSKNNDTVKYGAIFNECTFKAEEGVPDYSVAIARPWGIYSAVAVLNSNLSECIAKGVETTNQKNTYSKVDTTKDTAPVAGTSYYVLEGTKYVATEVTEWHADVTYYVQATEASRYYNGLTNTAFNLDANHLPTVNFAEYNNQGLGAMTADELAKIVASYTAADGSTVYVQLVKYLTDAEAALYVDQKVIFANDAYEAKYSDNWAGDIDTDVVVELYSGETLLETINEYSGNTLLTLKNPTMEGSKFIDWYTDTEFKNKFDLSSKLEAGTLKLYAKFESASSITETNELDLTKITTSADNADMTADTLNNSFLTVVDSTKVKARYNNKNVNYCIENKDANLKLTFKGTGTLTIGYCSTSGSNASRIRLVNSKGEYITPTSYDGFKYCSDEEAYEITGSTATSITFTITEAGEYTIDCVSKTTKRGGRIYSIKMVDTYAVVADNSVVSENTTWSFRTDTTTGNEITTTVEGKSETLADGKLVVDATTGKFAPRNQQWGQLNKTTKLTFKVLKGAKVVITAHDTNYTVNGTAATDKETIYTATEDTTIEVVATVDTYIDSIVITYTE